MKNRKFLMLSHDLDVKKHRLAGNFMSEKLDGMRAVWIPQTAGRPIDEVFFANVKKKKGKQAVAIATGLWSRYGNIIHAPEDFTIQLPLDTILDGELNFGRGGWKQTMQTVKDHVPGPDWKDVKFSIFDSPLPEQLFQDGRINDPQYQKMIHWQQAKVELGMSDDPSDSMSRIFEFTYKRLQTLGLNGPNVEVMHQELLPFNGPKALARYEEFLAEVLAAGGEGVIIRFSSSEWEPQRSNYMFRMKAELDSEAVVIGYTSGEEGKHHGKLGSLRVLWNNITFDLSGFTDAERELLPEYQQWAADNAKALEVNNDISGVFPRGTVVQFKYREITADGKPKEARFYRKHD